MHICAKKGSADHHKLAWKLLERNGNDLLRAENLEGQTPVRLAEDIATNAIKGAANNFSHLANQEYKSQFGQNFAHYKNSNAYMFVGAHLESQMLWILPKMFFSFFVLSAILDHFKLFAWWSKAIFVLGLFGLLLKLMKTQGHRIPHPCAVPNPVYKGNFLHEYYYWFFIGL